MTSNLIVEVLPKREFRLTENLNYKGFIVPKGFVTDFASSPRFSWTFFPPFGKYEKAAVLHDWQYKTRNISRKQSDKYFLKHMKEDGVGLLTRWIMYLSVRVFGGPDW